MRNTIIEVNNLVKKFKNVEIIRKTSAEASKDFGDESLDFVYLDGDHSYEAVKADLEALYPKIKAGGYILGILLAPERHWSDVCDVRITVM